jgi:hypothetical protein
MEITDIAYGEGRWIVYAHTNSGVQQALAHTTDFNRIPELIRQRWDQGYIITEASYGQGAWVLLFSRPKDEAHPLTGRVQVYSTISGGYDEVQSKVQQRWEQGYAITGMASNGELWVIVGTTAPDIVSQQIASVENLEELLQLMYKARQQRLSISELVGLE